MLEYCLNTRIEHCTREQVKIMRLQGLKRIQCEINSFMQNLDLCVASLNIYKLKYEGNNKIDHLISLCRRTSILDNLILIEKPNIYPQ